jgi:hypothetical protein
LCVQTIVMHPNAARFIKMMSTPWKSKLFLFLRLPSAFFSGVRICSLSEEKAVVSVPYKWFSKNPFRSTYFACLAMAGEMSTGLLAMSHCYKRTPAVSMLVVKMEAHYFKKATGISYFTCEAGKDMEWIINECIRENRSHTYVATAVGRDKKDEKIAEFFITWSFKPKS